MQISEQIHEHHEHEHNHLREDLQAGAKAALLVGLGLYFVYNILSGNLANYINQRFAWLSYVAVVLFLLLGAMSVWDLLRRPKGEAHHHHDHDHDHEHGSVTWKTILIIAVPLVLGTLVPSRPLGSAAVDGTISMSATGNVGMVSSVSSDPLTWNVLDWLRAFNGSDDPTSFNGKQADVVGFVYREASFGADQFMVARFTVSCCVADASAIGLPVSWADASEFKADTWVRVQGTFEVGEFRGDTVPVLHVSSIEVIEQPEHPYLYP